jgi:hypothetical protein
MEEKLHHDRIDDNASCYLMIMVVSTSTMIWSIQTTIYHKVDRQKKKKLGHNETNWI